MICSRSHCGSRKSKISFLLVELLKAELCNTALERIASKLIRGSYAHLMDLTFHPQVKVLARFPGHVGIAALAEEIGVYSASPDFIRQHCGPIAQQILSTIPEEYYEEAARLGLLPNCDIRIHRLYPGDFPGYPGWHCDGEYRADYHSQPDMSKMPTHRHLVATVSTAEEGVSNTEFLDQVFTFHSVAPVTVANTLWGQVHTEIEKHSELRRHQALDGELTQFDSWTLHRAMPAKIRGWRLFFRMSMWHKPYLGDGGMISRQEQVYKLYEGSGW
jgi:hypothetical protein